MVPKIPLGSVAPSPITNTAGSACRAWAVASQMACAAVISRVAGAARSGSGCTETSPARGVRHTPSVRVSGAGNGAAATAAKAASISSSISRPTAASIEASSTLPSRRLWRKRSTGQRACQAASSPPGR